MTTDEIIFIKMSLLHSISYTFNENEMTVYVEKGDKYHTARLGYVEDILKKFNILPIQNYVEALNILFKKIPDFVVKDVIEITENTTQHIFIIRMEAHADIIYSYSLESSMESGWRYYITGRRGADYKTKLEFQFVDKKADSEPLIRGLISPNDITINKLIDIHDNHCFEVKIKNKRILLDCGLPNFAEEKKKEKRQNDSEQKYLNQLRKYFDLMRLDWIILTHNHRDHTSGLKFLLKNRKTQISKIIGTKTTLTGYYTIIRRDRDISSKFKELSYSVKFFDSINIAKNCKMYFYPAGHIPGSLSVLIQITGIDGNEENSSNEWNFLYTSDFYYESIPPIDGFEVTIKKLPKKIDFAIIDGSNSDKINIPLKDQLRDIYREALDVCERAGSVMIATEAYSHALFFYMEFHLSDYNRKDETSNKSLFLPEIFLDDHILKAIERVSLFREDFSENIQKQMDTLKNPFESWRIQPMKSLRSVYEALSRPSIILTSPTDVQMPPLKDSFPLCSMDANNLFLFGYFTQNDPKTTNGIFNSNITLESLTNLNGILSKEQKITYNPKCKMLNKEEKYEKYLFQNHADNKGIRQFLSDITIEKKFLFHNNDKISMKKIFPAATKKKAKSKK